jgi:uncharacterized protein (DUF885 family)
MKCRVGAAGLAAAIAVLSSGQRPAAQQTAHASPELLKLADDFHQFRSPLFRSRTWRPTHRASGVPDYAAVVRDQKEGLPKFQARLAALDPSRWPVHDRVDYLLLRSEMDDVDFEQRVLRETAINPAFYIEQALQGIIGEVHFAVVPYSAQKADAIIAAFERVPAILEQGPKNLALAEAAPELAKVGVDEIKNIRENTAAGIKLFEPHTPEAQRPRLKAASEKAAGAFETYAKWIETNLPQMKGHGYVGRDNLEWFMKRVNFVPWSMDEVLYLGEIEKNRFLMSIEIEKTKNKGLKPLSMPTTKEWIEWFRLTYLQTKYFLKDMDLISFPPYVGESYIEEGAWQEPFGEVGNRSGILGFPTAPNPTPSKRLFVVPETHWFAQTYWDRTMRLDPITDFQHSDWPGHYFEGEVTKRNPCPIRAVRTDTGFSQGWAHYFEELFLNLGYPYLRGPRTRELTYNFLLLRAVRVPMDMNLSSGKLTFDEAVKYQIDRVASMEPHISKAEDAMYLRWPYQATSYIVGKKQIEQILGDRIEQSGYTIDWRKFHDQMLSYGQIPLALVRWEMTGHDDQVKQFWSEAKRSSAE